MDNSAASPASQPISPSEPPRKTATERVGHWIGEIPTAGKIAGVFILAAGAFFGATASFERKLTDLEKRLPATSYAEMALLNEQVTNLRLIERELSRLEQFVTAYRRPAFVYAEPGSVAANRALQAPQLTRMGTAPYPGASEPFVVSMAADQPFPEQFPIEAFTSVILTQATRSLPPAHSTLVVDLYTLHLAMSNYNHLFLMVDPSARMGGPMYRVRLTPGLERRSAEFFAEQADRHIDAIRTLLPSLKERVVAARHTVERLALPA
jgi:hypothetical protein